MSERLVRMAAAADDEPTLEQVDEMLAELRLMPRQPHVSEMIDELLEVRSQLAG